MSLLTCCRQVLERLANFGRRKPPRPEHADTPEGRLAAELQTRFAIAIWRTRTESKALAHDGGELAERIRNNARAGREAMGGKS